MSYHSQCCEFAILYFGERGIERMNNKLHERNAQIVVALDLSDSKCVVDVKQDIIAQNCVKRLSKIEEIPVICLII